MLDEQVGALLVDRGIGRSPRREPVDVAVEHAEGGGDQHRVMDLDVGCALAAGGGHVVGGDRAPVDLDLGGDREQRAQLVADRSARRVALHLLDQGHPSLELHRGEGAVRRLAERALVQIRDVGGDQFALAPAQGVLVAKQNLGEVAERPGGLGAECESAPDSGDPFGQVDVWHVPSLWLSASRGSASR